MKILTCLATLLIPCGAWAADDRPNILFLLADDFGWADAAPNAANEQQGSRYHETPQISKLAKEGFSFRRAYVQQNCAPTRAALLSGEYASRPGNGVFNVGSLSRGGPDRIIKPPTQNGNLPSSSITLPKVLADAGYTTALFGKEHGFKAGPAGFQIDLSCAKKVPGVRDGRPFVSHYFAAPDKAGKWHFANPAFDRFAQPYTAEYVAGNLQPAAHGNDPASLVGTPKHLTDAMADAAIDFIREHGTGAKPFYMNVSFHSVHTAIIPRPDLERKYAALPSSDPRHQNPEYAALVEELDESVGRIVRALDDPNGDGDTSDSIAAKTLVVLISDNGGAGAQTDNSPLRGEKGMFYDGGIRVPLIMRQPGTIKPGSATSEPVHAVDFYPTFAEIAGAKLPSPEEHPLDGTSLTGLIVGRDQALPRDTIYWHFPGYMDSRQVPNSVIRKRVGDRWFKLIYYYEGQVFELYDLQDDWREAHNLLTANPSAKNLSVAENLRADLCQWLKDTRAPLGTVRKTGASVEAPIALAAALTPRDQAIDGSPISAVLYPDTGKPADE